jgi:micrococcal nuclease
MKRFVSCFYLITFFVLLFCGQAAAEADKWYNVKWVDDGDTIVLMDGRHVRYIGINSPEIEHEDQKAEPYGYEAKKFNKTLVFSKKVRLELDTQKYDRYGRLLAYVFLNDGTFVNAKMIEEGRAYCLYIRPNVKYHESMLQSQREAMVAKKGIWKDWEEKDDVKYAGNQRSRRFHLETCPYGSKISKRNRVFFSSRWDAFWQGFSPCKSCIARKSELK